MTPRELAPLDASRVSLEVNGSRYEGWKQAKIQHGIEQIAGVFALQVSDVWPEQLEAWAIAPGDSCTLKIGNEPVITGYIDSVRVTSDAKSHTISVQGRDKTGDLVDCSAPAKEWINTSFEAIAQELVKPYGIQLNTQVETGAGHYTPKKPGKGKSPSTPAFNGGGKLPRKACNPGESVHRLLERLGKFQGVLLVSDRRGGLLITRAGLNGRSDDALVQGENILKIDSEHSFANLFTSITVKGQGTGASIGVSGALSASGVAQPKAAVARPAPSITIKAGAGLSRSRPLILICEDQADSARAQARAEWEAGTRQARSKKLVITTQGWRQSTGRLWEINTLVPTRSSFTREGEELLVSGLEFNLDQNGSTTMLTLYPAKAYDVLKELPVPDAPSPGKKSGYLTKALEK